MGDRGRLVIDGRVRAHIEFSGERSSVGGHLEEGCLVLTFTAIALADLGDVKVSNWDTFKNESEFG